MIFITINALHVSGGAGSSKNFSHLDVYTRYGIHKLPWNVNRL